MINTQVAEMARVIAKQCEGLNESGCFNEDNHIDKCCNVCIAEALYKAGYRKQREGHWFILEYEYFTCSECVYYHPNGCDSTAEAKEKLADGIYPKYCSECGAKMKGGAE